MLRVLSTGPSAAPLGRVHQTVTELWQRGGIKFIRLALYWGSAFWCFFHAGFTAVFVLSGQRSGELRRSAL